MAKLSPIVGVLGHRQVGKTTLLENSCDYYVTFDDETTLDKALADPKAFIASYKRTSTAIDECQLVEKIFPALKERVRIDRRPGQFILSGSVRFTSKALIRESLTGRLLTLDLLPMTLSELDGGNLPDWLPRFLEMRRVNEADLQRLSEREFVRRMKLIEQYQNCGGLPGICFIRDARFRADKIQSQLETILSRDVHQIHATTLSIPELLRFIRELAKNDGEPVNHQALRRATGITPSTQKKLLYALEGVFILRHLPIEGARPGSAILFEDQAEVLTLGKGGLNSDQQWSGFIYRNLREQILYRSGLAAELFQFRTRSGVTVPFAVRTAQGVLGVIPLRGSVTRKALGAAQSFQRKYMESRVLIVTDQNETRVIDDRTILIPAAQILFPA
jgi:hypothetical protein